MKVCTAEVSCPNGCFVHVKKRDLDSHLENDCPLTFVECIYGCGEKVCQNESVLVTQLIQHSLGDEERSRRSPSR